MLHFGRRLGLASLWVLSVASLVFGQEDIRREAGRSDFVTIDVGGWETNERTRDTLREPSVLDRFLEEQEERELKEFWDRSERRAGDPEWQRFLERNTKLWEIGQRFRRHVETRMQGRVEFVGADLDDAQSIDRLDDWNRNEFNEFMEKRFARAGEWYLANVLDPEASEMRDLLPPDLREFRFVRFASLRFGRSTRLPQEIRPLNPTTRPDDGSTLDQNVDSSLVSPFVDAGSSFFDPEVLGEVRANLRLRAKHIGGGIGWRPWPTDFPIQFRADMDRAWSGQERLEASALMDVYDLWTGKREHREHFYVYARYDFDEETAWFGVMFSSN